MKNYHQILGFIVGVWLIIIGLQMSQAQRIDPQQVSGTKGRNAAVGAGIGAGAGILTWLAVGGVGLATGGLGIGLGAIGLTAIGAGAGAVGGAATGSSGYVIHQPNALYSIWAWGTIIVVGTIFTYRHGKQLNAYITNWWKSRSKASVK